MYSPVTTGIRCLGKSQRVVQSIVAAIEGLQSAIFMGLVDDSTYQSFDTYPFNETKPITPLDDAQAGFEDWEANAVKLHFGSAKSVLVVAGGGCRELLALNRMGYEPHGWEYGDILREHSNRELERLGYERQIAGGERFALPGDRRYDAAFLARTYLSNIRGRANRVTFLRSLRRVLLPGAPVVLSYYIRARDTLVFRGQAAIANAIRWCRGSDDAAIEVGDHIDPESPLLHHHYTTDELADELMEAGFEILTQDASWFGWAVARPTTRSAATCRDEDRGRLEADASQEELLQAP